jgi:hypothetical protein
MQSCKQVISFLGSTSNASRMFCNYTLPHSAHTILAAESRVLPLPYSIEPIPLASLPPRRVLHQHRAASGMLQGAVLEATMLQAFGPQGWRVRQQGASAFPVSRQDMQHFQLVLFPFSNQASHLLIQFRHQVLEEIMNLLNQMKLMIWTEMFMISTICLVQAKTVYTLNWNMLDLRLLSNHTVFIHCDGSQQYPCKLSTKKISRFYIDCLRSSHNFFYLTNWCCCLLHLICLGTTQLTKGTIRK